LLEDFVVFRTVLAFVFLDRIMTSQYLFVTGSHSESIVERLYKHKHDERFRELYVSMIDIDDRISDAIVEVLSDETRTWDGIHVAQCTGNVDVVINHVLEQSRVKKFSLLPSGRHLNDECLLALANGLKNNRSVKSFVFRVDLCQSLSEALAEGLSATSALEELSLILSTSDTTAINTLAEGIKKNVGLKTLLLNRCSLEDGQVASLIKALENHPSLQELSVQGSSCRAMGIVAISGLLQSSNQKPFKLDLSKQNFSQEDMFGISFLAPSLPANKSMRFLDLSHNKLSEIDVVCLASALAENEVLEELKLVNCNISDKGAQILARQLRQMTGLKSLWLQDNPFGLRGAESLYNATMQNRQLEQLWLPTDKGEVVDQLQEALFPHLQLNQAGQKLLYTDHNGVPQSLWPLVLARVNDVSFDSVSAQYSANEATCNALYTLLQGPALCLRQ
jgi:Ran GTPase-activating protein (RanGAP) involved in mRNA processing and transport